MRVSRCSAARHGKVYLVGAGPGDPDLLTVRAVEVLGASDVVLVDALVHPAVLRHVSDSATVYDVGKRGGGFSAGQEEINRMLINEARAGNVVARLKGGDPFIFGRGGEEAEALVEAGVEWEVIPGVSSGIAAAAYAGIPLLHRAFSSSVTFVAGHEGQAASVAEQSGDTLVVFMCGRTLVATAQEMVKRGRSPSTPVAVVQSGTYEHQRVAIGTIGELAHLGRRTLLTPVLGIVGEVVRLAEKLHWFGPRPVRLQELAAATIDEGEFPAASPSLA
jgi:uroporphyrin-III C-methyltransferase